MILLDTNLLCRITSRRHPQCAAARSAMRILLKRGEKLAIVPQNLYEFWAVATRATAANGLGLTTAQASQWLVFFQRRFTLLPDRDDLPGRWHELVKTLAITGFRSHDARLAAMQCYGIARLLTFNGADFKHLPVTVVDPTSVK
jgi:predicted nucleic acid-binding protein